MHSRTDTRRNLIFLPNSWIPIPLHLRNRDADAQSRPKINLPHNNVREENDDQDQQEINVKRRRRKAPYHVQHVILIEQLGCAPGNGHHMSHLCANTWCARPGHAIIESQLQNQRRKHCTAIIVCRNCQNAWQTCQCDSLFKCLKVSFFNHCGHNSDKISLTNNK